jgi:hypothetical protein
MFGCGECFVVAEFDWSKWRKSSHSGTGSCLQVRLSAGHVEVRDSKAPDAGVLTFRPDEWHAFIAGAKDGEFDLPG